ncbi:hypothetical protein HGRIS_007299 [Hohenbuehelia grisea]|uniref:Uncharacterized protein n=1 Tax=Hohenbuehelia grisea TaxID=104357 RepID=A0ABR3J4Q7_9AGAR
MAILAPPDWPHITRDNTMDVPTQSSNALPRQRASPANDHTPSQTPQFAHQLSHQMPQQQQQQPFAFTVQQQPQGSWTPSIAAQPFYPSFYANHQQGAQQQQPYQLHGQPAQPPYFDPAANAQLAQWYQQMMYNAQQGFPMMQNQHQQRTSPASGPSNDYFAQNQITGNGAFNPFPAGTPPPPHRGPNDQHQQPNGAGQHTGFHPYRRPTRQASHQSDGSDWRPAGNPHPPYARPDASASSSSVNSSSGPRQRTDSNQSGHSGHNSSSNSANASIRSRTGSPAVPSASSTSARSSSAPGPTSSATSSSSSRVPPHNRKISSSSSGSASSARGAALTPSVSTATASSTTSSASSMVVATPRPARPSPLSQGTFTAGEKRMSRDDSVLDSTPTASMLRSGGLKGRLRRALSFNAASALKEEETDDDDKSIRASTLGKGKASASKPPGLPEDDGASTATVQTKKKGRAASLFNARLNVSTDNISLSSTVSSASVMIRKLGSMGRLARRNSLAGITSLFKDKDKDKDKDGEKKGKKKEKKGSKAEASEASVSHVTAELDRMGSDWTESGLTPAAELARRHTLKSNEQEAARKALQEAAAAAAAAEASASVAHVNGTNGVPTWDRNTATGRGSASPVKGGVRVNEDGTTVLVEDDDDDDRSDDGHYGPQHAGQSYNADGWDDDDDWGDNDDDEDVTIRVNVGRPSVEEDDHDDDDEPEPWASDVRRSLERSKVPAKGILKYAGSYDQRSYTADSPRPRSNSYNSAPGHTDPGPLARIPSPDPDHIDGLHRHGSHSSAHGSPVVAPALPPLSFDSSSTIGSLMDSPKELSADSSPTNATHPHAPHPQHPSSSSIFSHSNSSAPALSTIHATAPLLPRSTTAPAKRLAFASNLSVYDTFSASVYDRRSEPATWSRLTPALAQRIKEELNSYKMEEMEVHASSRIHTQFFV